MLSLKIFDFYLILLLLNLQILNFPLFVSSSDSFEVNKRIVEIGDTNLSNVITQNNSDKLYSNKILKNRRALSSTCIKNLQNLIITLITDNNENILMNNKANTTEYDLVEFTEKAFNICSLNIYSDLIENLRIEIGKGDYPKTCLIYTDNQNSKDINNCFHILKQIEKDPKFQLSKVNKNNIINSQIIPNKKFRKHKKNKTEKDLPFSFIDPIVNDSNLIQKQRVSNKKVIIPKTRIIQYPIITTTINQTFNKISTVPTIIHEIITKTKYDKIETKVLTKLNVELKTVTKTVGKKTVFKPTTITKTVSNNNEYNQMVDANYIIGDASTLITTTLTTMARIPYVSRFCNVLTNFGLYCASNVPSTSNISSSTTTEITTTDTIQTSTTKTITKTSIKTFTKTTKTPTTTTKTTTDTQIKTKLKSKTTTIITTFLKTIFTTTETDCEETVTTIPAPDPDCDDDFPNEMHDFPTDKDNDDYDGGYYYDFIDDDDNINYNKYTKNIKNIHQKNRKQNINPNLARKINKNNVLKNNVFNTNYIYLNKFIDVKQTKGSNTSFDTVYSYIPDSVLYGNLTKFIQYGNRSNYSEIAENNGYSFVLLSPLLNLVILFLTGILIFL